MPSNFKINEDICYKEVQLIGEDGSNLGIMPSRAAYFKAKEADLDLVCINPNSKIPVCKILNYGKFKYEQQKKEREIRKNQHNCETHEIQIKYAIAEHDLKVKAEAVKRIISRGDDVRIVLRLRGREESFKELAKEKVIELISLCSDFSDIKKEIWYEGRDILAILKKKK